ncbi:acyl-CoA dehydrogenase family protein [Chloroflexota bacterium]
MDFSLTESQEMIRRTARDFVERECPIEVAKELNKSETGFSADVWHFEQDNSKAGFSPDIWRKMAELGWVGMILPEAYGGRGSDFLDLAIICQELGWAAMPSPLISSGVLCGLTILEGGTEQQKQQLLPSIAKGERILALALTEQDYGWGPESVQLTASARDGKFVLNGTKLYIPDAHIADQLLCVARTRQSRDPQEGITLFLVDRQSPGLSCHNMAGFVGDRQNAVVFDSVEVDRSAVIGELDRGWSALAPAIEKASVILCAYMVGGCQRVWEMTVEYCNTRKQFGVAIGTFQRVQDLIIEVVNALDAARWTTYEALWKIDEQRADVSQAVTLAKIVSSEGYRKACTSSSQAHGGMGVVKDYPLYLYIKKSRSLYHYLGSPLSLRKSMAQLLFED